MNLYNRIKNADCEIPESFGMKAGHMIDFVQHSHDDYDLACIAFKFGYMQGQRASKQACKTNKAGTAGEAEQSREQIIDMVSRIRSERRLKQIFTITRRAFINDGLEVLNERKD